jgi:hypothetical protein
MHYMCDLCAGIHPMLTPQLPCHIQIRVQVFEREKAVEKNVATFYHPAPPEIHINTIV